MKANEYSYHLVTFLWKFFIAGGTKNDWKKPPPFFLHKLYVKAIVEALKKVANALERFIAKKTMLYLIHNITNVRKSVTPGDMNNKT